MYFKITNKDENHHGFQYQDGLNILKEEFNDDPDASCCKGGFYFTNATNIFKFLDYGIYLREVTLPTDNKDFKMLKDKDGDKWRSNMIILGKRYDLNNVDTFKFLVQKGADINVASYDFSSDCALKWSVECGNLDIVKFLVESGANIHVGDDCPLEISAGNGHLDIVKFLVENGANIHSDQDLALRWSAHNGHLDVVKFLVENGANIYTYDKYSPTPITCNGHSNVADFLMSKRLQ